MFGYILIVIVFASFALAEEGEIEIPDNKTQCLDDMIQWCKKMQYSQGYGMSMLSVTFEDPKGFYRVLCYTDSNGTTCSKNGNPWFSCSSNNTFGYKGNRISSPSDEVDDDICKTADKALNELFVQNLSLNDTVLGDGYKQYMETLLSQMEDVAEQVDDLFKRLQGFDKDFWPAFGDGFPFGNNNPTPRIPDESKQGETDQSNQVEKE